MREAIKNALRRPLSNAARNPTLHRILWHPFSRLCGFVERERRWQGVQPSLSLADAIAQASPDRTVRHGPFRGMRYPNSEAVGSSLFPKLLGCYEQELHFLIETICARPYLSVVDVGCAEGYYAVGLAMRIPSAVVHAFDTSERGLALCRQMAALNGVESRMSFDGLCDADRLPTVTGHGKALVISDCEGFEIELFSPKAIANARNCDVLIEVHDFRNPRISAALIERFRRTHKLTVIRSLDDDRRVQLCNYPELEGMNVDTRMSLLAELRPADMEWFFFEPRLEQSGRP